MAEAAPGEGRIADIEALRAIAVLFVVLHHMNGVLFTRGVPGAAEAFRWFGGWAGVDLFFVISGFVIARVLLVQLEGVRGARAFLTEAGAFWIRRAFRLLPLAWAWLALLLLLAGTFNDSGAFGPFAANVDATVAGVLQFANWRFAHSFGSYEYGASFVYWSLSLEEQFYLVLPVLVVLLGRHLAWVLVLVVALQAVSERGLIGMAFRTDALCLGVLIALAERAGRLAPLHARVRRARAIALPALLALLGLVALFGSPAMQDFPQRVGAIAFCAAAAVLLASADAGLLSASRPVSRALLWGGSRSYALYLTHVPVYFALREVAHRAGWDLHAAPVVASLVALAGVVALAEAGYRAIETPWRARGRALATRWHDRRSATRANPSESLT